MRRDWVDDCGRRLQAPAQPQRIACLCPSLTETLYALGLGARVVARTRYCIHPADAVAQAADIGGTKQINVQALAACQPDLIIAEKEENRREDVAELARRWPVFVFDIQTIEQATASIQRLGELCGVAANARELVGRIDKAWAALPRLPAFSVVYLIWRKPWMAAGRDTYIDAVLARLGLDNRARALEGRYPSLSSAQLTALQPELCLLSSEPYPFREQHAEELAAIWPDTRIRLVDGESFSWYGARMLPAAQDLNAFVAALTDASGTPGSA